MLHSSFYSSTHTYIKKLETFAYELRHKSIMTKREELYEQKITDS